MVVALRTWICELPSKKLKFNGFNQHYKRHTTKYCPQRKIGGLTGDGWHLPWPVMLAEQEHQEHKEGNFIKSKIHIAGGVICTNNLWYMEMLERLVLSTRWDAVMLVTRWGWPLLFKIGLSGRKACLGYHWLGYWRIKVGVGEEWPPVHSGWVDFRRLHPRPKRPQLQWMQAVYWPMSSEYTKLILQNNNPRITSIKWDRVENRLRDTPISNGSRGASAMASVPSLDSMAASAGVMCVSFWVCRIMGWLSLPFV